MDGTIRVCELEAMAQGIPALFPFQYHKTYPESLPMPELTAQNILNHSSDAELGSKQRAWVEKYHGSDTVVDKLISIYQSVTDKTHA
jgi:hypothetical protein